MRRAAAVARCDHDIEAAIERGEHSRELARMVGVVAIHDEQHVVRGAVLRGVRDEAAQPFAQALVDRFADDFHVELIFPLECALDRAIGAAIVVEHDAVIGASVRERFLEARKQRRYRRLLVIGGQPDPQLACWQVCRHQAPGRRTRPLSRNCFKMPAPQRRRRSGQSAATLTAVNKMNPTPYSAKTWWWLYAAAALSLYTTLGLPYIGEEAVYTITSLEMRLNHDYFVTTLYGTNYGRPPLLNWLIIPLAEMLGWDRMLLASRLVAATATVLTGLVLAWLTLNLTRNRALAAFAAVVFLSGDALFYRGWLAYADPLLTLCVFGAIACLWVAVLRKEGALLWLAVVLVTCGFLAKVQTAYLFYGVALVVLAADRDARRFLLGAHSIAAHAAAVAALLAWNAYFTHGTQSASTGVDILLKIKSVDLADYLHQLWSFPPETVLRLAPASLVFVYYWWRTRAAAPAGGGRRISVAHAARHADPQLSAVPGWDRRRTSATSCRCIPWRRWSSRRRSGISVSARASWPRAGSSLPSC